LSHSIALLIVKKKKNEKYKPSSSYHANSSVVLAFVMIGSEIASEIEINTSLTVIHSEALITP